MIKCFNCGKEVKQHDGKRHKLYCNEACKKAYSRKAKLVDNGTESISGQGEVGISGQSKSNTIIEANVVGKCWCCGADLEHPKQVCCGPCAWSGKAKAKRAGNYPPLMTDRTPDRTPEQMEADLHSKELTGGYKLTPTERANYKPASELGKGEHNPVSKPGDSHYEGVST